MQILTPGSGVETSNAFTDQTDNIKADSAELDSTGHYMLHLKMFMFSYLYFPRVGIEKILGYLISHTHTIYWCDADFTVINSLERLFEIQ